MRPIPFKLIYILGLDENSFPGTVENDSMDLCLRTRKIGDINRIESMNYLFLETLVCCREKLYLSYVAENLRKDTEILPSPVIRELINYCGTKLISPELLDSNQQMPICKLPLNSSELRCFDNELNLSYDIQRNSSFNNYLLALYESHPVQLKELLKVLKNSSDKNERKWAQRAAQSFFPEDVQTDRAESETGPIEVDLKELKTFLENPLLATLKRQGIQTTDQEDPAIISDEPFELAPLDKSKLFVPSLQSYLLDEGSDELQTYVAQNYHTSLKNSKVPIPLFTNFEQICEISPEELQEVRGHLQELTPLNGPVIFGTSYTKRTAALSLKALTITLSDGRRVNLNGCVDDIWLNSQGQIAAAHIISSSDQSAPSRHTFFPFLLWLALQSQTEFEVAENFKIYSIYRKRISITECHFLENEEFAFAKSNDAENYLQELLEDFLKLSNDYLPFSVCEALKIKGLDKSEQTINMAKRNGPINFLAFPNEKLHDDLFAELNDIFLENAESSHEGEKYSNIMKILPPQFPADAAQQYHRRFRLLYRFAKGGQ